MSISYFIYVCVALVLLCLYIYLFILEVLANHKVSTNKSITAESHHYPPPTQYNHDISNGIHLFNLKILNIETDWNFNSLFRLVI